MTVHHVRNLSLRKELEVVVTLIDGKNHLWEAKSAAIPNLILPQIDSRGDGRTAALRLQCQLN